ncbi:amino acid adenylation domain-containing protein [Mycetohabitans rhizoxinica]|uniref:amino acid adenylation domain-containing protein n=1 Tax=Mycetohabitans rhizoxinica TaxID=412963 RepID=UPI0030D4C5E3
MGSGTLAVYCAQQLVAAGHVIRVVLATDVVLQTWAIDKNIHCVATVETLNAYIEQYPVDWLFSVDNPFILPASLIRQIREGAFNYHDAPLPRYAGHHATSWALLAHESHYAITWHHLAVTVDAGHIAVQPPVAIDANETALTLNLKCFQAARAGFNELLSSLCQRSLTPRAQDLTQRSFYAKYRRLPAGAYLRWTSSARDLSALARALAFGELYPNPLGCPKLLLEQGTVQVARVERLDQGSGVAPGTVISIAPHAWQVATSSEDVLISGFATLEGEPLSAQTLATQSGLCQGARLLELSQEQFDAVTKIHEALAPHELFWQQRLARRQPLPLPFEQRERDAEPDWVASAWCPPLRARDEASEPVMALLAVFAIYLARLTEQTQFQIGWRVNDAAAPLQTLACLAPVVPMDVTVELGQPFAKILAAIKAEHAQLEQHHTFVRDLIARYPTLRDLPELRATRPWPVAVSVLPEETHSDLASHCEAAGALLTLQIDARGAFRWVYDAKRLGADQIQRISEHLRELGHASLSVDDAEIPAGRLNLLPSAERELLLHTWNATQRDYPSHSCIHQLFEAQVERTPDATALVYEDQTLSYAQLNAQANRLAHQLIKLGVKPETRVAICVERSLAMLVGLLAILKAGGAYVPLDPAYPAERLATILADAAPTIVLADAAGRVALGDAALASRTVLDPNALPALADTNPSVPDLTSRHLAYVIYTSGSTGRPKGVMVQHQGIGNLVMAIAQTLELTEQDRMLQFAPLSFDTSVEEIFTPLTQGAAVVLRTDAWLTGGQRFWTLCQANRVSVVDLPVQFWAQLTQEKAPVADGVRAILIGGDALSASARDAWFTGGGHRPRLLNVYGPTEATITATIHEVTDEDGNWRTIGRPLANTRLYILDAWRQPVPVGVTGELYIGGVQLARGYLNRPQLTAERFVPDPFAQALDARMYKTGDLARYRPDGHLEFLGRNDHQIKLRGFRIEPGEIEARLVEHPQVRDAVVLVQEENSDKRLVAYVVAEPDEALVAALRAHVAAALPEYMVPAAFVRLDALPLTPNGKLDRRALPAPDADAFAHQAYEAPQGELEIALAAIWAELLGVDRVSRHDSFFALGGHSLLAVQLIERLRRIGLGVSVHTLFAAPTLRALASSVSQNREVTVPANKITPESTVLTPSMLPLIDLTQADIDRIVEQVPGGLANIQDIYALSPLQDGILFHHLLASQGDPYLLTIQLAFDDRAVLDRYIHALQQVVNRHDVLRTAFVWQGLSTPAQVVWRHAPLSITELTLDPADGPVAEQLAQRFDPRHYRVDLTQAPLLRFVVAQDTDGRWVLLELQHHLLGDHSTTKAMHTEVQAFLNGRGDTLPLAQPFRNLIAQARLGGSEHEHVRFFTDLLADVEEPTLPFGLADVHRDGTEITEAHRMLPQSLNDRLRAEARRLRVSLASLCHLAWAQVLARASGQQRVMFGTVLFGRMQAGGGADSAMGLFINTLPLRVDLHGSVRDSVWHTHARLAALLEHEHASLALAQRCSRVPVGTPLFSALLNYRHNAMPVVEPSLYPGIEWLGAEERDNYPIGLSVEDFGQSLGLTAQIVEPLDPDRVCGYMQQALESLAETLEHAPDTPIQQLEILPEDERALLLETWNATQRDYPLQRCVHQLFEAQTLSYAELNAQANRLARHLQDLGVRPNSRVALYAQRNPQMIVGMLATLKAGGAYVPLDPAYPPERLSHMVTDSAPIALLSVGTPHTAVTHCLGAGVPVLDLQADGVQWVHQSEDNLDPHELTRDAQHLAYVIYTSGSTGQPKGVMVHHQGVVNLITAIARELDITAQDRMLQFAPLSFDTSVEEIFTPLAHGAAVVLRTDAWLAGAAQFWALCKAYQVSVVDLPVQFWAQLAQEKAPVADSVRAILIGGDALSATARDAWFAGGGHRPRLLNVYGPTETTVTSTVHEVIYDDGNWRTIGRPIANTRIYLLDTHGQPVPLGAAGELYIGGAGVARGYLNRPGLSAERFTPDPFSSVPGARMYKTGDLARYRPDCHLEFLGRNDHQVKIRGFRIELGEIEACLSQHPQVRDAVVIAQGDGHYQRLVAYIVAEPDESLAAVLRAHVAAVLPEYMVPAAFVRLDALPLTPNGKLDRRALPAPDDDALVRQAYEAPQGEMETTLAAIWAELLGVERVSRHDSFFALGGHSLLAVQMISRSRTALGMSIPMRLLFQAPTLAALAQHLSTHDRVHDDSFAVLLPIQPNGIRPPLFCIHPVSGLSWHYRSLASHLGADQPVYGLQARGLDGVLSSAPTIEAMAADYIDQIRRIQPNGPYYLLGWSLGGNVACSMATQLEQQGERVALLAVLDATPDHASRHDKSEVIEEADFYISLFARHEAASSSEAGHYLWGKTRAVIQNNQRIVTSFLPRIYGGDMLFFRATMLQNTSDKLIPPQAWQPYVRGYVEVHDIACKHYDMELPTPTAQISHILRQKLNALHNN